MKDAVFAVLLGAIVAAIAYGIDELDRAGNSRAMRRFGSLGYLVCGAGGVILITTVANKPAYALVGVAAVTAIWIIARRGDT